MDGLYNYRAHVLRVIDGDSLQVVLDLGVHVKVEKRLRLLDIGTPELRPRKGTHYETEAERQIIIEAAKKARDFVREKVEGKIVKVHTEKGDSFGCFFARIWYYVGDVEVELNQDLLDRGLAEVYKR